jgi:hypothetical protein
MKKYEKNLRLCAIEVQSIENALKNGIGQKYRKKVKKRWLVPQPL